MASKKHILLKIVIIGDSGVGKTSLIQYYTGNLTGIAKPTIGSDFSKKETVIDN